MSVNKALCLIFFICWGGKRVIMNKDRFDNCLNTVKYKQSPVSRRLQAAGPPHLHCDGWTHSVHRS